jgi:hypothetical protein
LVSKVVYLHVPINLMDSIDIIFLVACIGRSLLAVDLPRHRWPQRTEDGRRAAERLVDRCHEPVASRLSHPIPGA